MSKKIESIATSVLLNYQSIVAGANQNMDQFATHVAELAKNHKISKAYADGLQEELLPKVQENNKIIAEIDTEVLNRLKRDFPGATTGKIMDKLVRNYQAQLKEFEEIHGKKEEVEETEEVEEKPKPNLSVEK